MTANALILHIGTHKTGTSSIQETLARHRASLLAHGIVFPKSLPANHSNFFYDAFAKAPQDYHANRRQGLTAQTIAVRTRETIDRLHAELKGCDGQTVVFSAEDASTLTEPEIASVRETMHRLVRGADVRIVLYTRHPVDFVASAVQENVKGNAMSIARSKQIHMRTTPNRYRTIYARHAAVFGEEAITFRAFEQAVAAPGGLIADFCATLGRPAPALDEVRRNAAIADEVVFFLSARTDAGLPPLGPDDAGCLLALPGSRGGLLSGEERDEIWRWAQDDVAFLNQRFGILYRPRPAPSPEHIQAQRARFLQSVAEVLPRLSPAVGDELERHLSGRPL